MDESVPLLYEDERGCGYRKPGGLYLMGSGIPVVCGRLPINIKVCPTCGEHLRHHRGYQWINFKDYMGKNCDKNCSCHTVNCPICFSDTLEQALFMWVGKQFYTPADFRKEADEREVSKRLNTSTIPEGIEVGKTWVLLAHLQAGIEIIETSESTKPGKKLQVKTKKVPAIFYAFRVTRVEKVLTEQQSKDQEYIDKLREQGITPVVVKPLKEKDQNTKPNSILDYTEQEAEA